MQFIYGNEKYSSVTKRCRLGHYSWKHSFNIVNTILHFNAHSLFEQVNQTLSINENQYNEVDVNWNSAVE